MIFISIICLVGIGVTAFYAGTVDRNLDKSESEVETLRKEVADLKSQSTMTDQTTSPNSHTTSGNTKTYSNTNLPDLKFEYDQNVVLTETLSSPLTDPNYQQYKYPQIKLNTGLSTLYIDTTIPGGLGSAGFSLVLDQDFKQINDKFGRVKFDGQWVYVPIATDSTSSGVITKNSPQFEENYAPTYVKDSPTYIEDSLKLKPQVVALFSGTEQFLSSKTLYPLPEGTTQISGNILYVKIYSKITAPDDLAKFDEVIKTLKY